LKENVELPAPARGRVITLEFDEESFPGQAFWLYATVLDRYLGDNAGCNRFSRLIVSSKQRKEVYPCPPRAER
jgi:type VI protein secretion system component VasA